MKKNIITIIFGISFFVCIALLRSMSLHQEINIFYLSVSLILSVVCGVWLFIIRRNKMSKRGR